MPSWVLRPSAATRADRARGAILAIAMTVLISGCISPSQFASGLPSHPIVAGDYQPPDIRLSIVTLKSHAEAPAGNFEPVSAAFPDVYEIDHANATIRSTNFEDLLLLRHGDSVVVVVDERETPVNAVRFTQRFLAPGGSVVHFRFAGGHGYMDHPSANSAIAILGPDTGHHPMSVYAGFPVKIPFQRIVKETLVTVDGGLQDQNVAYEGSLTVDDRGTYALEYAGYEDHQGDAEWFDRQWQDYTRRQLMVEP